MNAEKMEIVKAPKSKEAKGLTGVMKKLDPETTKLLNSLNEKANKKPYGRKIRDGEIICLALKLVTQEHLKELQAKTISAKDRLQIAYEAYQKKNGKIPYSDFVEKLLSQSGSGAQVIEMS